MNNRRDIIPTTVAFEASAGFYPTKDEISQIKELFSEALYDMHNAFVVTSRGARLYVPSIREGAYVTVVRVEPDENKEASLLAFEEDHRPA